MFAVTWLGLLVTVPLRFLCKNAGLHTGTRNTASFGTEFYIVKHDIRFRDKILHQFLFSDIYTFNYNVVSISLCISVMWHH